MCISAAVNQQHIYKHIHCHKDLISTYIFIVGDFMGFRPTNLRFNDEMSPKGGYDYSAQHSREQGRLRYHQVMIWLKHNTNASGEVD